jgi:mannose-1-phosphate guanylyltransferase
VRAIILAGGEATRLRPLSERTPKQLMPVLNRPMIAYLLTHLRSHGIDHVTLALTRTPLVEQVRETLGDGTKLGIRIDYAYEETPLGSGGAIAGAAAGWDEPFLVCNGDIITDLDISAMVEDHHAEGAELSIFLRPVDDPSRFGVAVLANDDHIVHFVEKPEGDPPSNLVNAGVWLFQPSLLDELDGSRHNMVERELFPALAAAGREIFGYQQDCYWIDIGTHETYLQANRDLLAGACDVHRHGWPDDGILAGGAKVHASASISSPALLAETSSASDGAHIRGPVSIGARTTIEPGASVAGSVLWDGVTVSRGAVVANSILASGVIVQPDATIEGAVIAHDATISAGTHVPAGTAVAPGDRFDGAAA